MFELFKHVFDWPWRGTHGFEKLLLWYHDLYRQRTRTRGETHRAETFMHNVCEWLEGGYDKMVPEDRRSLLFILHHFLAQCEAEANAGDDNGRMNLW